MANLRRRIIVSEPEVEKPIKSPVVPSKTKGAGPRQSYAPTAIVVVVLFVLYTIAPIYPTIYRIADVFVRGDKSIYNPNDLFRFGLYADMVKDPTKAVFPEILPTELSPAHDIFLQEYEEFNEKYSFPLFMELNEGAREVDPLAQWKVIYLRLYQVDTCVAKFFPRTIKLIEESSLNVPTIMFSRMAPHQHIPNHIGASKGVLRLLMALKVPQPSDHPPYLKVWNCGHFPTYGSVENPMCSPHVHEWKTVGQELAFDDSFIHGTANPTDEERVALFLDMARPDLRGWRERLINAVILQIIRLFPVDAGKGIIFENMNKFCGRVGVL